MVGGRPLRALTLIILGWSGGRVAIAGPWSANQSSAWAAEQPSYGRLTFAIPAGPPTPEPIRAVELRFMKIAAAPGRTLRTPILNTATPPPTDPAVDIVPVPQDNREYVSFSSDADAMSASTQKIRPAAGSTNMTSRWTLDAWTLVRNGSSRPSLANYGQLGTSQAGVRVDYDLTPGSGSRIAPYVRLSSALVRPAAPEDTFGIGHRPARSFPFDIGIERRIALGTGARHAFAIVASTGFGPSALPFGPDGERYAQSGIGGFQNRDAFADGKFSLRKYVVGDGIALDMSTSGGAPNLTRLDIGPQVQMRFSTGRIQSRMAAEWRQRITGRAQLGSGPAITLVAGF